MFYVSRTLIQAENFYEYFENNDQGKISSDKIDYSLNIWKT